jgi:two-component sensor histidine kinase
LLDHGSLSFLIEGDRPCGPAVAAVIDHDWSGTPLGPIGAWSPHLKCAATWVLEAKLPAALIWGAEQIAIVNDALRPILRCDRQGVRLSEAFAHAECDVGQFAKKAMQGRATLVHDCQLAVTRAGFRDEAWMTFSCSPVRAADGTVEGAILTGTETTAGVEAKRRADVVASELSHRLKNSMAMVQAIATQSLRNVQEKALVRAFTDRIVALGRAQDVLLRDNWDHSSLETIVRETLSVHAKFAEGDGDGERIDTSGPELMLAARAVLSMAMLMHELATNAMKYGSLSVEGGRIAVDWQIEEKELVLHWRETGGPPAQPPTREGFGSRLINMGLVGTGHVQKRYTEEGFAADFRAPLHQLLEG